MEFTSVVLLDVNLTRISKLTIERIKIGRFHLMTTTKKRLQKEVFFNILHLVDTTSITEPIINHKIEINNQLRKVQEGINTALFFFGGGLNIIRRLKQKGVLQFETTI